MCGRYSITNAQAERLADRFGFLDEGITIEPRYNVAPTQAVPVVIREQEGRRLRMLRWGLVPSWAEDESIGNRMINARAETLAQKPSFRRSFRQRRCLVLADGFYEWGKLPGRRGKVPMRFTLKGGAPFAFAGLWDSWRRDGGALQSFTIITTEANELVRSVHNRMPVILLREHEAGWMELAIQEHEDLLPLLAPHPADRMECYEVGVVVNSPANDTPACIAAVTGPAGGDASAKEAAR